MVTFRAIVQGFDNQPRDAFEQVRIGKSEMNEIADCLIYSQRAGSREPQDIIPARTNQIDDLMPIRNAGLWTPLWDFPADIRRLLAILASTANQDASEEAKANPYTKRGFFPTTSHL